MDSVFVHYMLYLYKYNMFEQIHLVGLLHQANRTPKTRKQVPLLRWA